MLKLLNKITTQSMSLETYNSNLSNSKLIAIIEVTCMTLFIILLIICYNIQNKNQRKS